jgi:hypothetical protein
MERLRSKVDWVLEQHSSTNHMYDKYIPYEFHLRMVVNVYERFKHLLSNHHGIIDNQANVYLACWTTPLKTLEFLIMM